MCSLYDRLDSLCQSKGVKGGRMCTDLGLSKSLMTDLKNGRKKSISAQTAQKIATYFDVTVGYLIGEEEQKEKPIVKDDGLSEGKRKLIEKIKKLPEDHVLLLLQVAERIE